MVNLPFKKRGNDQRSVLYQRKALTKNKSSLKAKANRGESYISPLINTNLSYEDFIKLCQNPRKYLVPIDSEMYWAQWYRGPNATDDGYIPAVKIDDIEIAFAHEDNLDAAKTRWDFLVRHVNFDRLIYVLVNARGAVPYNIMRDFSNLYGEKLMFYYGEMFNFPVASNIAFAKRENLAASADAIENSFDLVGWLNREYL